jgi:pilus assembly protein CpaB
MKISRYWWMLIGALASGLLAAYVALVYVSDSPAPLEAAVTPARSIIVASRDLPAGTIVQREDVETVAWPGSAVPEGFATQPGEVVGRGVIVAVDKNEPLLQSKLADKDAGGGLAITIPDGMRAVSVEVDKVIGVAGFVLPGTRVDVLATVTPGNNQALTTTKIILQNIRTLAADQKYQQDSEGKPQYVTVVTLLVTPAQSEALTLAATEGKVQLALRNTLDLKEVDARGLRIGALVADAGSFSGTSERPRAIQPVHQERVIESYQGGNRTLLKFGTGGGR